MSKPTAPEAYEYGLLDVEGLLAPIPGATPVGPSLRYEEAYDRIMDEIRVSASISAVEIEDEHIKKPDWDVVRSVAAEALEYQSKDLTIATWLSLALLYSENFQGMREGLQLVDDLCEAYWDDIHPTIEDDPERRLAPFVWLSLKLPEHLLLLDLAPYAEGLLSAATLPEGDFTLDNLRKALDESGGNADDESDEAPTDETEAAFHRLACYSPPGYHANIAEEIDGTLEVLAKIKARLQTAFGPQAPNFIDIEQRLVQLQELQLRAATAAASNPSNPDAQSDSIAEAFAEADSAADRLMVNLPDCPSGYLIRQALDCRDHEIKDIIHLLLPDTAPWEQARVRLGNAP